MDFEFDDPALFDIDYFQFLGIQQKYPESSRSLERAYESATECALHDVLGAFMDAGADLHLMNRKERNTLVLPYIRKIGTIMNEQCSCVQLDKFLDFCREREEKEREQKRRWEEAMKPFPPDYGEPRGGDLDR